jgi:hypothetical protein
MSIAGGGIFGGLSIRICPYPTSYYRPTKDGERRVGHVAGPQALRVYSATLTIVRVVMERKPCRRQRSRQ